MSRIEALEHQHKRYFTGIPCRHGHTAERYTLGGQCVDCTARRDLLRLERIKAGHKRVPAHDVPVSLPQPREVKTDYGNLNAKQVEQWYDRVRNLRPNAKLYKHHPLD